MVLAGLTAGVCAAAITVVALANAGSSASAPNPAGAAVGLGRADGAPDGSDQPTAAAPTGGAPASGSRPGTSGGPAATELARAAPASVAFLRQRYGVSAAEAARRLALQQASTGLAERLTDEFPGEYGGMWLDQAGGGILVVGATRPDRLRASLADGPDPVHVRVQRVDHSLQRLGSAARGLADALDATEGVDVLVDEPTNSLVVLTGDRVGADDRGLPAAVAAAGVPVRTRPRIDADAVQKWCDPRYCEQAPMRGGIRLDVPRDDGTVGGCTSGFNVRSAVNGRYYLLTAGHCVLGGRHTQVDQTWHQYPGPKRAVTVEDGNAGLTENAYPNDYAIMPYQAGAQDFWFNGRKPLQPTGLVNFWCPGSCTDRHDVRVTGATPVASILTGWVVCATGAGYTPKAGEQYVDSGAGAGYLPGTRCGTITGKTSGGIDVRICARAGDSGGPLFTEADGKALGILSYGDEGQGACTNAQEINHYAPVATVLARANARTGNALNLQLATSGPLPPLPPMGTPIPTLVPGRR